MAYALADRGVRLLNEHYGAEIVNPEWSRKNRQAGRPFIEHRLEVMDFYVALQAAAHDDDIQLIPPEEIVAAFPEEARTARNPLCLRVELGHNGAQHEFGIIPDLVFGLKFADGSRRCFIAPGLARLLAPVLEPSALDIRHRLPASLQRCKWAPILRQTRVRA
jgi:hypothetical protein